MSMRRTHCLLIRPAWGMPVARSTRARASRPRYSNCRKPTINGVRKPIVFVHGSVRDDLEVASPMEPLDLEATVEGEDSALATFFGERDQCGDAR